jgi:uncharacterized membrane-anchored protein YitT (DUF2179 family)
MQKQVKDYLMLTIGTLLLSVGVYFFKFPNHFTTGGVSGISIILGQLISSLSPGTLMMIINYSLLAVGLFALGKGFTLRTVYCTVVYSFVIWLLEKFYPMTAPFTNQPVLELVFAILLPAVGSAIMFNLDASSGGTDIVAMILKKYTHVDIGKALLLSDAVIAFSSVFVFGIETCMFSVIGLLMKAFLIDSVIESINLCKYFTIVTTFPREVCEYIIKELNHSATVVDGRGAFTGEDRKLVFTACKRGEALALKNEVHKIDQHAFIFISNTSEIIGKGFRTV